VGAQDRPPVIGSARYATTAPPAKQLAAALVLITEELAVGSTVTALVLNREKAENLAEMGARSSA